MTATSFWTFLLNSRAIYWTRFLSLFTSSVSNFMSFSCLRRPCLISSLSSGCLSCCMCLYAHLSLCLQFLLLLKFLKTLGCLLMHFSSLQFSVFSHTVFSCLFFGIYFGICKIQFGCACRDQSVAQPSGLQALNTVWWAKEIASSSPTMVTSVNGLHLSSLILNFTKTMRVTVIGKWNCKECKYKGNSQTMLKTHIEEKHTDKE